MSDSELQSIEAGHEKAGRIVSTMSLKVLTQMLPVLGPILETAISEMMPDKRFERLEDGMKRLEELLKEQADKVDLSDDQTFDVMEEGIHQFARAFSDSRRQNIAELVSRGLTSDGVEQQQTRHFLRILNQIGDEEIALLTKMARGDSFVENGLLVQMYEPHLDSLGLLAVVGEDYNGDQVGSLKTFEITETGRNLIEHLGLTHNDE